MRTLFLIIVLLVTSKAYSQSFNRTSREICKCNKVSTSNNGFHKVRLKLKEIKDFNEITQSKNYYILEYFDFQDGGIYGEIWNTNKSVKYKYVSKEFNILETGIFPQNLKNDVMLWNTKEIIEKSKKVKISPSNMIYVSKINVIDKNVECFSFNQFF